MAIEVILKKPVSNLGAEADIVKVKPGYARNYLFPQDIAVMATSASKRQIEELKKKRAEREAQELNEAEETATKLAKLTLTFQMQTGGEERVFGSVTAQDIIARLEEMGHKIDKKKLGLPHPLKTLGDHVLNVNFGHGIQTKLKIVLAAPMHAVEEEAKEIKGKAKRSSKVFKKSKTSKEKDVKE
ncbi:MAG: 50S ribosomal protein L9 [Verrucomicrobiota bacterium]